MSYCDYSDLPKDSCAHCQGFDVKTRTRSSSAFEAQYSGRCHGCPDPIEEGDLVVKTALGYAHDGCR